ncbi:MAG TPA: DJ-1/PfpI family protein [Pirellulales bacterium]|nr:DJ-1/PfpI family protein [Pirellulales bacterium]
MTSVGMLLYPGVTQLDLAGAYEVLARLPDTRVTLVAAAPDAEATPAVRSEFGLTLIADEPFLPASQFDVLVVPGGPGVNQLLDDDRFLDCLAHVAEGAEWITAVCTGALLLGAAGLLRGYRATTHWQCLDMLALVGATPVAERVVVDRNRVTGAGVTAGIDFGLTLAAELRGRDVAERIQLLMEYAPAPPFDAGSPRTAEPHIVRQIVAERAELIAQRRASLTRRSRTDVRNREG